MLSKNEDFYRSAPSLRQAGHFRVESLRNKNADQVYIVPGIFQKASLIGIPFQFSLSENSPVLNRCKRIPHQLP